MNNKENGHRNKGIMGIPLVIAMLCAYFALGYVASKLIFRFTGMPSDLFSHIISSVLGFAFFALTVCIVSAIQKYRRSDLHHGRGAWSLENVVQAMTQIATGNFNIFLPIDDHDPFKEVAESVNKMARELGTMEELRQTFISDVSHEIQSPLTSISGFAALLRKESTTKEDVLHYAAIIETESRRLSGLSENLLKLSTLDADITPFEMKDFRLDKQIESVLLTLEPQWAEKYISPEVSLDKIHISGNEDLLSQVWINLLHNAIKFTPERGFIRVTLTETNGEIHCTIADNGIGIPKENQIHIFERFYKVDKSRDRALGGNGLGLSLVKKIVELHGGTVTVKSDIGKGTVFTVHIPNLTQAEGENHNAS